MINNKMFTFRCPQCGGGTNDYSEFLRHMKESGHTFTNIEVSNRKEKEGGR